MEITTQSNLTGLALKLSGRTLESPANVTENEFAGLIANIYEKLFPNVIDNGGDVSQIEDSKDEILSFHLGTCTVISIC